MLRLDNIVTGWKNYLSKDEEIEKLAKLRVKHCIKCPSKKESKIFCWVKDEVEEISSSICSECKCPIAMKVRSINEKCPKEKW